MLALDLILRISTVILSLDTALAFHQTLVRHAVDSLHLEVNRRSNSLAKDLRVAFGGIFPRALTSSQSGHVVYCKPSRQVPLSGGSGGGSEYNGTSIIGTRTSPTARPTSTETSTSSSPTVTSPWKLIDSHVYIFLIQHIVHPTYQTYLEWVKFLRWLGFLHRFRSDEWLVLFFGYP